MTVKLLGLILIVVCGAAAGFSLAGEYKRRYMSVCAVCDMLSLMLMMLQFEAPTVEQLICGVRSQMTRPPLFTKSVGAGFTKEELVYALKNSPERYSPADEEKLSELFLHLGEADKQCEMQRLMSCKAYFERRREAQQQIMQKNSRLARTLGVLGGIFAAVMLS